MELIMTPSPTGTVSPQKSILRELFTPFSAFAAAIALQATSPMEKTTSYYAWERELPAGTTLCVGLAKERHASPQAWNDPAEQIRRIGRYFGLRKTELKDVLGVSRQTLYDWLAGKYSLKPEHRERLMTLHELAQFVRQTIGVPLPAALVHQPNGDAPSLLEELRQERLEPLRLRKSIESACARLPAHHARSAQLLGKRLGFKDRSPEEEARTLADNIDSFTRK